MSPSPRSSARVESWSRPPDVHRFSLPALYFALLAAAALLGGCALNGDFGRPRSELVTDDMHAWVGREAVGRVGDLPSTFPLTDDERQLRDLAFALIQPSYDRNRWYSVLQDYGLDASHDAPPFDRSAYWTRLDAADRRSQASSYAQIVTDARNDVTRLDPFFTTAARVADMDDRRAQSLTYVAGSSGLSDAEADNARRRNDENAAVVGWVCRSLKQRAASDHYALDRLVIRVPSADVIEAERSINLLQMRSGQYCKPARPLVAKG
jgi:hypothetical protein